MIIDVHTHIGLSRDGGHSDPETLMALMKESGVTTSVVFPTDEAARGDNYTKLNDKVIALHKQHPDKFLAFARIVPSKGQAAVEELKRCCELGVHGLKLKPVDGFHPKEAGILFEVIKDKAYFPVLMHTAHDPGNEPKLWEHFFKQYPKLNFILAHGGKDDYRDCAQLMNDYPNVYADTSTLSYHRTKYLYTQVGAEKILFASDYPYSHPSVELAKFRAFLEDPEDQNKIFYQNAAQLLGLEVNQI